MLLAQGCVRCGNMKFEPKMLVHLGKAKFFARCVYCGKKRMLGTINVDFDAFVGAVNEWATAGKIVG